MDKMKLGVVMDPIESINFKKDSTLSMMLEAQKRGHELFYMKPQSLFIDSGISYAETSCVKVKNDPQDWYSLEKPFNIVVDGSNGIGIIEKPNTSSMQETMDEEESSGI